MPSIAEATRAGGNPIRRRLVVGVGFVLIGGLLAGLGAAGSVAGTSVKTGLSIGGITVLFCLAVLAIRPSLRKHEQALSAVGLFVSFGSILALWMLTPADVLSYPVRVAAIGFGYLSGIALAMGAMLAGITMNWRDARRQRRTDQVAWTKSSEESVAKGHAADGGDAEDEITFLLDDD